MREVGGLNAPMERVEMPKDGSCLFHAVAAQVPMPHQELRRRTADFVESNLNLQIAPEFTIMDRILAWIHENSAWIQAQGFTSGEFGPEEYVNVLRQPGTWGGELELIVLAHMLERRIDVLNEPSSSVISYSPASPGSASSGVIRLLCNGFDHYDALVARPFEEEEFVNSE